MKDPMRRTHALPCCPVLLCSCALMLLCSPASPSAAELPETAKLIPPETVLLVDIDNFSQLREQFEKTNIYKLYKDPAMAAFVDDFKTRWQDANRRQDDEFVRIIADAGVWPQGKVAIAFVLDEQAMDANEPPVLFISEWGEKIDKATEAMDEVVQKAVEDGAHRQTEDYRGTNLTTITFQPAEALSYCFIDDCLIGSVNPGVLKFVIAQINGAGSPTLADDTDYAATIRTLGRVPGRAQGRIDLYVNIKQIIKTALAEDTAGKAKAIVGNLGLDNVTSFGCSIDLAGPAGGSALGKAFLKIDGTKKGICKMFDLESAAFRTPQFIPESACSISFVNLNIKEAYDELAKILNSFSPQLAAIMYMPLLPPSPEGEPSVQLKADIIDHFASQIVIAQSVSRPPFDGGVPGPTGAASSGRIQSLVALAINNRNALEKSLSLLHSKLFAPNNPDARRQLLGHTIYSVDPSGLLPAFAPQPPGQPAVGPGVPKPAGLALTVTDTHLIFASEPGVERAIRALSGTESVSVSSKEWFTKARSAIPSVVGFAALTNNAVSSEQFWSALRGSKKAQKGRAGDSGGQISIGLSSGSIFPLLDLSQAGAGLFDFSLLPEFDTVRKYFGLSASYGLSRQDGFFFEFKYLNPDGTE